MHPLQVKRSVLVAAIDEQLGLAREYGRKRPYSASDEIERQKLLLEATRLTLRLLEVQKEIEDYDLD